MSDRDSKLQDLPEQPNQDAPTSSGECHDGFVSEKLRSIVVGNE